MDVARALGYEVSHGICEKCYEELYKTRLVKQVK